MADRIKLRRDTAANWTATNPVLAQGEPGFETDTGYMKIGDGTTAWASLDYFGGSSGGTVTSVGLSVPTGLQVSGSPVTSSGTLAVSYAAGYAIPTTTKQTEWNTAYGWGNHATAGYLTSAAIGTTVQAYDADLTSWAAIAPSSKVDTTSGTASGLTLNDGYTEEVFAVTGTTPALSPTNGSIQTWTLSGNSTPTAGTWASGQSITLMIDDGTDRTINWTSVAPVWKTDGGSAPTLNATGFTAIALWKVGTVIYGARVGDA